MCELAGPQHREIGTPISTGNASWRGPNIENFEKKFYRQCKLEKDRNKFCENIIFVLIPLAFT
ncbi:nitrogen fixation protein NifR [Staphylococcus aureus]|uniref:Nitrogen fixation protein NifR n=1 Tax=Staphylococcus aureus TaxID=1280 RepID=A0AB74EAF6_STAAU|nr:nitrogen fixation protein NifR [Staphylococcus aureus]